MLDFSELTEYVGYIATAIAAIALIPQAIQILKNGNFSCISIYVYSPFTASATMWLLYGVLINKLPLILSNTISLILAGSILMLKFRSLSRP
jgi:MtN3 and saliva related transmembrane protein